MVAATDGSSIHCQWGAIAPCTVRIVLVSAVASAAKSQSARCEARRERHLDRELSETQREQVTNRVTETGTCCLSVHTNTRSQMPRTAERCPRPAARPRTVRRSALRGRHRRVGHGGAVRGRSTGRRATVAGSRLATTRRVVVGVPIPIATTTTRLETVRDDPQQRGARARQGLHADAARCHDGYAPTRPTMITTIHLAQQRERVGDRRQRRRVDHDQTGI